MIYLNDKQIFTTWVWHYLVITGLDSTDLKSRNYTIYLYERSVDSFGFPKFC